MFQWSDAFLVFSSHQSLIDFVPYLHKSTSFTWGLKCLNDSGGLKFCGSLLIFIVSELLLSLRKGTENVPFLKLNLLLTPHMTKLWIILMRKRKTGKTLCRLKVWVSRYDEGDLRNTTGLLYSLQIFPTGAPFLIVALRAMPPNSRRAYCNAPKNQQMETCPCLRAGGYVHVQNMKSAPD